MRSMTNKGLRHLAEMPALANPLKAKDELLKEEFEKFISDLKSNTIIGPASDLNE